MNQIFKKFLIAIFVFSSAITFAGTNEFSLKDGTIMGLAPPGINKQFFLLEFGFVTEKKIKKWDYNYNAYVTASLFQDWIHQPEHQRAGALGFKAGVMVPTQPWVPLLFTLSAGYAKTALHRNPFLGRDDGSIASKDMFLIEAGTMYSYSRYFLRFAYQLSTVKYFKRHTFFMLGVTY